jgi:hypothetical protein
MLKKIKIFNKIYEIQYLKEDFKDENDTTLLGQIDKFTNIIKIDAKQPKEEQVSTLLHEILHGITYSLPIELAEKEVICLECALMTLFKDNPKLLELLTKLNKGED